MERENDRAEEKDFSSCTKLDIYHALLSAEQSVKRNLRKGRAKVREIFPTPPTFGTQRLLDVGDPARMETRAKTEMAG
jgi:hypothetical protein